MEIERDPVTGHFVAGPKSPTPRDPSTGKFLSGCGGTTTKPVPESDTIRALKRENADLRKQNREHETLKSLFTIAVKDALEDLPTIEIPRRPAKRAKKQHFEIATLHISDTQIGKVTPSYNSEVARERLLELAERTIEITNTRRNAATIDEIRVYLGGDIVEGEEIFPGQAHQIDQSVFDQAIRTAPSMIAAVLLRLLEEFPRMRVCCVPGNHGRNGRFGTNAHPRTNWDNAAYSVIRTMLLGHEDYPRPELRDRLEFAEAEDFYCVDRVYKWGNLIVHGDQITGGFAGFPWYGTAKKAWGWIDAIPEPWDYLWFGHFHTPASAVLNHRMFLANGSTESANQYAQAQLAAAGDPCQRLCFFNESKGLIADQLVHLTSDRQPNAVRHSYSTGA